MKPLAQINEDVLIRIFLQQIQIFTIFSIDKKEFWASIYRSIIDRILLWKFLLAGIDPLAGIFLQKRKESITWVNTSRDNVDQLVSDYLLTSTLRLPRSSPFLELGGTFWAWQPWITSCTQSPLCAPSGRFLCKAWEPLSPPGRNGRLLVLPLTNSFGGPGIRGIDPNSWAPSISNVMSTWNKNKKA